MQNKKVEEIGKDIPGVDTRINKILVNKYAFESAVVKIRGKVKKLEENTEDASLHFQLTDRKGNFINIFCDKETDLQENDYIILSGKYDSAKNIITLLDYEKFRI